MIRMISTFGSELKVLLLPYRSALMEGGSQLLGVEKHVHNSLVGTSKNF